MTAVTNMVCPLCAQRHGQPHHRDCPRVTGGSYEDGWRAGCAHIADASRSIVEHADDERQRAWAAFACIMALCRYKN